MTAKMWATSAALSAVMSAADARCALGTIRICTGAMGFISRKAYTVSSSYTLDEGISPATMRQKRQSFIAKILLVYCCYPILYTQNRILSSGGSEKSRATAFTFLQKHGTIQSAEVSGCFCDKNKSERAVL